MDPVSMAMSACLCARLRAISQKAALNTDKYHYAILPSMVELEQSIIELFQEQEESGIWPKYFPLFHYQGAGSNFCFTFEMLEAVLKEFSEEESTLIENEIFISGLERAVIWCEKNRLKCSEMHEGMVAPTIYRGWNSGGDLESLRRAQPESWATAVVHMFLWELREFLSKYIQKRILDRYKATPSRECHRLRKLMDIDVFLDSEHVGLKKLLCRNIIRSFRKKSGDHLRKFPVKGAPISALLFGPPGTSKTQVAKAIARELNWPLVEIDPSHFLQSSFQNIYVQAESRVQSFYLMSWTHWCKSGEIKIMLEVSKASF
jgi:hypothetical protein